MKTVTIYALTDPTTRQVMYIGATSKTAKERLDQHVRSARHKQGNPRTKWIAGLLSNGLRPGLVVIEVDADPKRETFWISQINPARLLNSTKGQDGAPGIAPSDSTRNARIKTPLTAEHKAAIVLANSKRVRSKESRNRTSRSLMGHSVSAETRAKLSDANKRRMAA